MFFQISEKWKKILLTIAIVAAILFFGYGFLASLFRSISLAR
tara:strand:+ start:209 stop:334 length:126 start_codon:yes stop_codon:yes gene_type:complete